LHGCAAQRYFLNIISSYALRAPALLLARCIKLRRGAAQRRLLRGPFHLPPLACRFRIRLPS